MFNIRFTLFAKIAVQAKEVIVLTEFPATFEAIVEIHLTASSIAEFTIDIESLTVFSYEVVRNFLKAYKYYDLAELEIEELIQKERFLADYHVLNFLMNEAAVDKVSITNVLVALSNLLRLCKDYEIDEIFALSLRIARLVSENKTYFVITEY